MTIMVLAMARRERDDETMITALCDEFPDEEIKALCTTESSVECRMLPEVKQYRDIIRDMDSRMKGSSSAAMYKAFEALGL
ncbi:hypothetical protein QQS21_008453 [Conoideocrella luteorostrata]|uniref:Uncharacterized protein n=1 Tax=Conoideocrella luteorostrata TaxID=1105319 RepID=A0AAJ0CL73_9HYPO|nr:hypothetical protein QQS21_008453 [Conoideocrella luteorostrata]